MPFPANIQNLATRIATEFRAIRTLIGGSATADISALTTTSKTSLVSAINEVNGKPAASTTLAALTDTTITSPATGHLIRYNASTSKWENVLGTDVYQPLDSDLTAIAALTTTAYGRAFLALANQAALMGLIPAATTTVEGKAQVATQAEVTAGTENTNHFVNSLTLHTKLVAGYQPLDSDLTSIAALATTSYGRAFLTLANQAALVALLPLDNDASLAANSSTVIATQQAVKAYADSRIAAQDAFTAKGPFDASTNPNYPAGNAGDTYRVTVAGKVGGASGPNVEVGDLIQCWVDGTAAGTHASVGANWSIIQTNIDGAVVGPVSVTTGRLASFNGTSGKVIQDAGVAVSTDGTMAGNSNALLPTQAAVRIWAYSKTEIGNPETDYVTAFETALSA